MSELANKLFPDQHKTAALKQGGFGPWLKQLPQTAAAVQARFDIVLDRALHNGRSPAITWLGHRSDGQQVIVKAQDPSKSMQIKFDALQALPVKALAARALDFDPALNALLTQYAPGERPKPGLQSFGRAIDTLASLSEKTMLPSLAESIQSRYESAVSCLATIETLPAGKQEALATRLADVRPLVYSEMWDGNLYCHGDLAHYNIHDDGQQSIAFDVSGACGNQLWDGAMLWSTWPLTPDGQRTALDWICQATGADRSDMIKAIKVVCAIWEVFALWSGDRREAIQYHWRHNTVGM